MFQLLGLVPRVGLQCNIYDFMWKRMESMKLDSKIDVVWISGDVDVLWHTKIGNNK